MDDLTHRGSEKPSESKTQRMRRRVASLVDLFVTSEVVGAAANLLVVLRRKIKAKLCKDGGEGKRKGQS